MTNMIREGECIRSLHWSTIFAISNVKVGLKVQAKQVKVYGKPLKLRDYKFSQKYNWCLRSN